MKFTADVSRHCIVFLFTPSPRLTLKCGFHLRRCWPMYAQVGEFRVSWIISPTVPPYNFRVTMFFSKTKMRAMRSVLMDFAILPIFVDHEVFLFDGTGMICCFLTFAVYFARKWSAIKWRLISLMVFTLQKTFNIRREKIDIRFERHVIQKWKSESKTNM